MGGRAYRRRRRPLGRVLAGAVGVLLLVRPACAQSQPPTMEELLRKIDQLQQRVDQLENERRPAKQHASQPVRAPVAVAKPTAVARAAPAAAAPPVAAPATASAVGASPTGAAGGTLAAVPAGGTAAAGQEKPLSLAEALNAPIPGLLPPEPMGNQFSTEDALRSDLPGIAFRVPGTDTQVRFYGFVKLTAFDDLNARNQTDTPTAQTIPLANGPEAAQGGEFGMTARFSRFGVDTRSLTSLGTLETRLEGDFGGDSLLSSTATFRLRQAWAELGTADFRVLVGQANSLWNEGVFETLIDATNLNQSFIRQAQVRATVGLGSGLTGQVSVEAPNTQFTSVAGVFSPGSSFGGAPSPAFNTAPDMLGRLTYRDDGLVLDLRGMLRWLSLRSEATGLAPPATTLNAPGWGLAATVRVPMRWLWAPLGADEALGMVFGGDGIGRYFAGNTSGQDALTNFGLAGVTSPTLDPLPAYGFVAGYRRFWTPQLRSNVSYAYARQDYPSYALDFTPGSASALALNRDMQQVFVNLIWSPFGTINNGVFGSGAVDVGLEYIFTRRDLYGGSAASGGRGGLGVANRIMAAAVGRF